MPDQELATLKTPEVAEMFAVDQKTVTRWVKKGKLRGVKTPGGRDYRYFESEVNEKLAENGYR